MTIHYNAHIINAAETHSYTHAILIETGDD